MAKIVSEVQRGMVHIPHEHTNTIGWGLAFEKFCFECGEPLEKMGEWTVSHCSQCSFRILLDLPVVTYKYCPNCGAKFDEE